MEVEVNAWKEVVCAAECEECRCCYDLICRVCGDHYAECPCPGPTMDEEYEYKEANNALYARRKDEEALK